VKILGRLAVFPTIPDRIARLHELAYNLWWTWNPDAVALYASIDPTLWDHVEHSAVRLLSEVKGETLERRATDRDFLKRYDTVLDTFDAYMQSSDTWFSQTSPDAAHNTIAYFCAEFGLHESLPIYSGGLGILAGDHCKEASDLGLPFVGVGFLYPQGYFRQRITHEGEQEAIYDKLNFSQAPAIPALDPEGREVRISVELPGRTVYAKVWRIQVGRVPLYLMDTDVEPNDPTDRSLSARLYGGDHELRIAQEIVLGIGGVRTLRALGIDAAVWHMNEGHSAFLGLERCRELVQGLDVPFAVAREIAAANAVFTTHTPVAAGNDVFSFDLVDRYFRDFWPQLGLDREAFHRLAREKVEWGEGFGMTILALRLSSQHNGVSKLHGAVSRAMWRFLWPEIEEEEVPIGSITNGVHTATWLTPRLAALYTRYLGPDWYACLDDPDTWSRVDEIPDGELWEAHRQLKGELFAYARARVARQRRRHGEGKAALGAVDRLLNSGALTLGFARRFATYKRATLLFRDPKRLARLLNNVDRPVQITFAGKAHPADKAGQEFIKQVYEYSRRQEFAGRIVLLEDYDIDMARRLVSGVDVWLNTPIRPHEASGTSGEKASLNGVPNCSIRDGWWDEAWAGNNGWAIGDAHDEQNAETRDDNDADALYTLLEREIVPLYYDRGLDEIPHNWVAVMKEAIKTVAPIYSMRRMVKDYVESLYLPALTLGARIDADHYRLARELVEWEERVRDNWPDVSLQVEGPRDGQLQIGQPITLTALAQLGALTPDDVRVELIYGQDDDGAVRGRCVVAMERTGKAEHGVYRYHATIHPETTGSLVYGVRATPTHAGLASPYELGLAHWA
jgi:starch phosphorylase